MNMKRNSNERKPNLFITAKCLAIGRQKTEVLIIMQPIFWFITTAVSALAFGRYPVRFMGTLSSALTGDLRGFL
jgi:hypothetical protein